MRCFFAMLIAIATFTSPVRGDDRHVLLITLDGFPAYMLNDPKAPIPTIRRLAAEGVAAEGMRVVNPSVTWPNHSTLATGVVPARHGVLFNGVLVRGKPGEPLHVDPEQEGKTMLSAPTLWDAAHAAGLSTGAVFWPCTSGSDALDDCFPDMHNAVAHMTPRLRDDLVQAGILTSASQADWDALSPPQHDRAWTDAACYLIRHRKPTLLLVHMVLLDATHHIYGPQTLAGYDAAAVLDAQMRDVLTALDDAGIRQNTTIIIASDHGFATATKIVEPNVILRKAGLLRAGPAGLISAEVQVISEGGSAFVYFTDPHAHAALHARVAQLFKGHLGIADVIGPAGFDALGLPQPRANTHMADMVLSAADGYGIGGVAVGDDEIRDATIGVTAVGYHGYLSSNPKMNAIFIAAGYGIRHKGSLGIINNTAVAPTIAKMLGIGLPSAEEKPLTDILSDR